MPKIKILNNNMEIEVAEGTSILEAMLDNDVDINNDCGANGVCGTCQVHIEDGHDHLSEMSAEELELLEMTEYTPGKSRLACQTRIYGDVELTIPD